LPGAGGIEPSADDDEETERLGVPAWHAKEIKEAITVAILDNGFRGYRPSRQIASSRC
jgi:hypothetical protein